MRALVVGGGGREHALVWKLAQSSHIDELHAAPGNPGMAAHAELHDVAAGDIRGMVELAASLDAGVVVVGPEAPLAAGIADALEERGIRCFGPKAMGARLEASKMHAKMLMHKAGIPTASGRAFTDIDEASEYVQRLNRPVVVKADGLAAGKGVTVCRYVPEAIRALVEALQHRRFADAGATVLVEEFMEGEEISILALCDGHSLLALPAAQDYKRAYDRNKGPNTGGMGSYSPVSVCTPALSEEVMETVFKPLVGQLERDGERYIGVIYAGLMLTEQGLRVVEFNCRFGDPETQAILPRLESDLGELILASTHKSLPGMAVVVKDPACVSVVAASGGYPEQEPLQTGFEVEGVEAAEREECVVVFQAGTRADGSRVVTSGGRVLAVSALGEHLPAARERAYRAMEQITFKGMRVRSDIAEGK
ncbi:MAG: phosphoribosylamine--glycine ligase [Actinomycetota bacterium]